MCGHNRVDDDLRVSRLVTRPSYNSSVVHGVEYFCRFEAQRSRIQKLQFQNYRARFTLLDVHGGGSV